MTDLGGVWRTIGGRRVFIKDGEDLATAMKRSGKFKSRKKEQEEKEKRKKAYEDYKANYDYEKEMPEGARFSKMLEENKIRTFADDIKGKETGYETYLRDRYGTTNEKLVSAGNKSEKDLYQEYKNEVIRNINRKRMEKGTTTMKEAYKKAFDEYKRKHPNTRLTLQDFIKMSEE